MKEKRWNVVECKSLRKNTKNQQQQESNIDCEQDIDMFVISKHTKIICEKNKNLNTDSEEIEKKKQKL